MVEAIVPQMSPLDDLIWAFHIPRSDLRAFLLLHCRPSPCSLLPRVLPLLVIPSVSFSFWFPSFIHSLTLHAHHSRRSSTATQLYKDASEAQMAAYGVLSDRSRSFLHSFPPILVPSLPSSFLVLGCCLRVFLCSYVPVGTNAYGEETNTRI